MESLVLVLLCDGSVDDFMVWLGEFDVSLL